jgi:hypothetical protein
MTTAWHWQSFAIKRQEFREQFPEQSRRISLHCRLCGAAKGIRTLGTVSGIHPHAIRVSGQLMDAVRGTQLWADAYDREISDAGTFHVQDDLTDHIVTTVADGYGVLVRSMAAPTRGIPNPLVGRDWIFCHIHRE